MSCQVDLSQYRNIGIMAHIDAGKTTITERILFYTGVSHRIGEVHEGSTIMDWMEQEQERGITITSATATCFWKNFCVNIIDTPGHVDFTIEVERSLRVLDGVIAVFCAVNGVQSQSETVWRQADRYKIPRVIFINKMDQIGANYTRCIDMIKSSLSCRLVQLQIPIGNEEAFSGIIDLLTCQALYFDDNNNGVRLHRGEIPSDMIQEVETARSVLIETACEFEDKLMESYLSGEKLLEKDIKSALRRGVINNSVVPVLLGAAFKNRGVQPLLDAIINYLPSPLEASVVISNRLNNNQKFVASPNAPLAAMAFKLMTDPYVGSLTFLRIYAGTLSSGDTVINVNKGHRERIGRLLRMYANRREEVKKVQSGDIVAVIGLKNTYTGDTICAPDSPYIFQPIHIPTPVMGLSIKPINRSLVDKLNQALHRLMTEDPSFRVEYDKLTGQIVIKGMGELHLEIVVDRLRREFKIDVEVGPPQVSYREAIIRTAVGEGRYIKQSGGRGRYGHCKIEISPSPPGSGFIFHNKIIGGVVPQEFIPAVVKGIEEACQKGVLAGFPLVDIEVKLIGGSYHQVDSNEQAFNIAGSLSLKEAAQRAGLELLEPVMNLEVTSPEEYLGNVMGDISLRRGRIQGMDSRPGVQIVKALIPLEGMFGYASNLRSATQGRAIFSMEFSHYEPVPVSLARRIIEKIQAGREAGFRGIAA